MQNASSDNDEPSQEDKERAAHRFEELFRRLDWVDSHDAHELHNGMLMAKKQLAVLGLTFGDILQRACNGGESERVQELETLVQKFADANKALKEGEDLLTRKVAQVQDELKASRLENAWLKSEVACLKNDPDNQAGDGTYSPENSNIEPTPEEVEAQEAAMAFCRKEYVSLTKLINFICPGLDEMHVHSFAFQATRKLGLAGIKLRTGGRRDFYRDEMFVDDPTTFVSFKYNSPTSSFRMLTRRVRSEKPYKDDDVFILGISDNGMLKARGTEIHDDQLTPEVIQEYLLAMRRQVALLRPHAIKASGNPEASPYDEDSDTYDDEKFHPLPRDGSEAHVVTCDPSLLRIRARAQPGASQAPQSGGVQGFVDHCLGYFK